MKNPLPVVLLVPLAATAALGACRSAGESGPRSVLVEHSAPDAGRGKRAFEISDLYRTANVSAPVLSPDGRFAVFTIGRNDFDAGKSWREIWRMKLDGSEQRQLTQGRFQDDEPTFAPDGKSLVFVSNRAEGSQLWTLPIDGGEPVQLTHFAPGVSGPVWSRDGRYLAVTSEIFPECGIDGACNQAQQDGLEGKLQVHVADELLYRHWTGWADGKKAHVLLLDARTGAPLKDLTPGRWESPIFQLGGGRGYDFAPDGKSLVFASNREQKQAETTNSDLWSVPVEGAVSEASALNLTADNDGWDGAPLFSPDGQQLAFLRQQTPGYESDLKLLMLRETATGRTRALTTRASFDNQITDFRWAADGRAIYFGAEVEGRTPIFKLELASGAITKVHTHALLNGWELSGDGRSILYSRRAVGSPPEIFTVASSGGEARQLTHFNQTLESEVDIRPVDELWVRGEGGYRIHCFLVKPHGFDPKKKYPLILNVHGGPQSQWADGYRGDWQVYPGKGYIVAFPNPTGSNGYGQDYCDAIAGDWGGRVYRDLMRVTDALAELPFVDAQRMGAMGWSYGGYMMMWMQGHTDRFKAIASMMGVYDLRSMHGGTEEVWFPTHDLGGHPWNSADYERFSPSNYVKNYKTPTLVITGELDFRVPYLQSVQFFTDLQLMGVPSRLVVFPKSGHWPGWQDMIFYYNAHVDWFHKYLGGEPPTYDVHEMARNRRVPPKG